MGDTAVAEILLLLLHPFNGLFSRTAWAASTRKVKSVLIKMRQGTMGFWDAVASAGPYANNLHLAPDHTNSIFTVFEH